MDWLNAQREEKIGFAECHSLVAKDCFRFLHTMPLVWQWWERNDGQDKSNRNDQPKQKDDAENACNLSFCHKCNPSHRAGSAHIYSFGFVTHAPKAVMFTSVLLLSFPYSRSCLRPPHKQCADGAEDRYRRPENPPKGLLAWSVLLITEAYGQRLLIIGHGNPYAFKLLQFGEIGLQFFSHLLGWESNTNAKLCGAVSQLARFSPERRPVQAHKE